MKKIEALIKPYQLDPVKAELYRKGLLPGVTATELHGYARGVSEQLVYRGVKQTVDLLPAIKIEIVAHDDLVARIVATLLRVAQTGRGDEGSILVSEVSQAVRIRTGEIDEAAIG